MLLLYYVTLYYLFISAFCFPLLMFKIQASVNLLSRPGEIKLIALLSNTCILLAVIRRGYRFSFMPLVECDVSLPVPFS